MASQTPPSLTYLETVIQHDIPSYPEANKASRARSVTRKKCKQPTNSELLRNNLIRLKQNRRADKLKEVTHDNIQMFLRIKAQSSHYRIKELSRHKSCRTLLRKEGKQQEKEEAQRTVMRCQSAKSSLLSRCVRLKEEITQRKPQKDSICEPVSEEMSNRPRVIHFRKRTNSDKQNENNNKGEPFQNHTKANAVQRALAQKLSCKGICKSRIVVDEEGRARVSDRREGDRVLACRSVLSMLSQGGL